MAFIFSIAALTDVLDGWLARYSGGTSKFGAFLDPVADKLIVAVALVLLVSKLDYLVIPAIIIIAREIMVSALREWMAELGKRSNIAVSFLGKLKTMLQMVALILLLGVEPKEIILGNLTFIIALIGYILLYSSVFLTVWSMLIYIKMAWPNIIKDLTQDLS